MEPRALAVFGATSAIAERVARLYAAEGARIFLAGRRRDRLEAIASDLQVRGAAAAATFEIDLDDVSRHGEMLDACWERIGAPDHALIAYGTLPDQREAERSAEVAGRHLHTNFVSPAILLNLLAERMAGGSAIAVITSVAGDRGRRSNYVYGAAKGGLSRFAEGLRHRLAAKGVRVVDVRPGFVDTPMTDGMAKGGLLWASPERVARDIKSAIERRNGRVYSPRFWRYVMAIITRIPGRLFHKTSL